MSGFHLLDASIDQDRAEWLRIWSSWSGREAQAHPAYAKLFSRSDDRVLAAVWMDAEGAPQIVYPFIVRPLGTEPWAAPGETRSDLITPYGYGGPYRLVEGADESSFWDAFDLWASEQRIVTSFARLSLFPDQLAPFRGVVEDRMPNVVRSVDIAPEDLWREYAHKVRKNVNRARTARLEVEVDATGAQLDAFVDIYEGTMRRRGAASGYYFPRSFFEALVTQMPESVVFFHVRQGGTIVSTELVLVSANNVYSFLGGTREEAFDLRPNDLLKHAVVEWAGRERKRTFVLGGGYEGADGIFKYKLAFAPQGEVMFKVGKRVHDPDSCAELESLRRKHEAEAGRTWEPRPGFFPPYRA